MKCLISFLNIIGFVTAFLNSTVVLFDGEGNELGYGLIAGPDIMLMPNEDVFQSIEKLGRLYKSESTTKYRLSSTKAKKINDNIFSVKLKNNSLITQGRESVRISRYPICNNLNIETLFKPVLSSHVKNDTFKPLPDNRCRSYYPYFNSQKQICGKATDNIKKGSPLIKIVDSVPYLIGFSNDADPSHPFHSFDLIIEKCDTLPSYDSCNHLKSFTSEYFLFCNALEMSENLFISANPEVIVIGSTETKGHFVQSGFAVVISSDHAIVFSDFVKLLQQYDNYEIYGEGKKQDIAFMINEVQYFIEDVNITDIGINNVKLLKAENKPFEDFQKATFLFDDRFVSITDFDELETLQLTQHIDQKLVIKNGTSSSNLILGTPVFYNGLLVGFQENDTFISVMEIKDFLINSVPELLYEMPSIEASTQSVNTLSSTLPTPSLTPPAPASSTSLNRTTTVPSQKLVKSDSCPLSFSIFVLTLFVTFV